MQRVSMSCRVGAYLATACVVALGAACGPGADPEAAAPRVERSTEGSTTTVRNSGGPRWHSAELVQEASIGQVEGPPEYQFGLVRAHLIAGDRIVVLDWQAGFPRVYDLEGTYVGDIGSAGDGPEQFRRPFGMAISPDGHLFVRDAGKGRVFEVTTDGQFLGDRVAAGGALTPVQGGLIWMRTLLRAESAPGKPAFAYRAFAADGPTEQMIRAPTFDTQPAWLTVNGNQLERVVASGGSIQLREVPFGATRVEVMSPFAEAVAGVSDRYRFEVYRADGSVMVVERVIDPFPVAADEADWHRRQLISAWRATYPDWVWEGPDIPPTKAYYRELTADMSGRYWVIREAAGEPVSPCASDAERLVEFLESPCWHEPRIADVFDHDGEFLGTVPLPDGLRLYPRPWIREDQFLGLIEAVDGTLYVRRYRLVVS